MVRYSISATDFRIALPEKIWLEPEHFEQAKEVSDRTSGEPQQWQTYLNTLATLAFESWLTKQLSNPNSVHSTIPEFIGLSYISVGEFKLGLIVTEHVLDEQISVRREVIEQPDLMAHFYVALEVLEEQETVIVRGFVPYNELSLIYSSQSDERCSLPLSVLDCEINHLLVYIQHLEPDTIAIPTVLAQSDNTLPQSNHSDLRVQLSQWLQGTLDEGWQSIEILISPEANLAWSPRNTDSEPKGGKLINLGMQLGNQSIVLLVTVRSDDDEKIGVNVQVLPARGARFLPAQLKLTLLSSTDKILQEVQSREQDNYIQLKPFRGKSGTSFSIEISFNTIRVKEAFEL